MGSETSLNDFPKGGGVATPSTLSLDPPLIINENVLNQERREYEN